MDKPTKNFIKRNDKYFILIDKQEIEVSKLIYDEYESLYWKDDYNAKLYYDNVTSFDSTEYLSNRIGFKVIASKKTVEDTFVLKEKIEEIKVMAEQKAPNGKLIFSKIVDGYNDTEIAKEIGISRQGLEKRIAKIYGEINKNFKD